MAKKRLIRLALAALGLLALVCPACGAQDKAAQAATTPASALQRLVDGNERFRAGRPQSRDARRDVKTTAPAQYPFAAVLSCIDSRVPPEAVFDQGIGDIFVARVAGNVVDDDVLGSLEYATKEAGAKLIVVLGHTRCGAVKGACQGVELAHLTGLLEKIKPAIAAVTAAGSPAAPKSRKFVDAVAEENVRQSVKQILERSRVIGELERAGRVAVRGAVYDVETGTVRFLK